MKKIVVILFGGKSVEHDISIITATQAMKNLSCDFEKVPVYIDKQGTWWTGKNFEDAKVFERFEELALGKKEVSIKLGGNLLLILKGKKYVPYKKIDAVLNCCHGNVGEDGAVQGLFKVCNVAQTSPNVLSSSLCMDKVFMKYVLQANNILSPNFVVLKNGKSIDNEIRKVEELRFPLIVKPSNLGSSIGISVAKNKEELIDAIGLAFKFDKKILCEEMVRNLREFNCACFVFKENLFVSSVNEVQNKSEIFSFEDKYLSDKARSKKPDKKLEEEIKQLTKKVYELFECQGVVRVDFLYDQNEEKLYVNEINTIPGSLSFYLYKEIKFSEILSSIINQSEINLNEESSLIKTFESDALKMFNLHQQKLKK
ncbi:MAG: D-alanine--D-alanine ligase [Clostridia bacterium]|nr:D-alanine--D-alanine ligase [Clostridia bacterium]